MPPIRGRANAATSFFPVRLEGFLQILFAVRCFERNCVTSAWVDFLTLDIRVLDVDTCDGGQCFIAQFIDPHTVRNSSRKQGAFSVHGDLRSALRSIVTRSGD